jgi:hypothetical protein
MLPSLLAALRKVPDHRAANTIHPLESILAMAVCAMLCGCTSELAITQWGEMHGPRLAKALGFSRPYTPCNTTLHYLFKNLDVVAFQKVVSEWLALTTPEQARRALEPVTGKQAVALDGKRLRGSQEGSDTPGVALVAAFLHHGGQVLDQQAMTRGDELQATRALLEHLPLEDRIITGDALLTQRDVTETVLEKGGPTRSPSRATNRPSKRRLLRSSTTPLRPHATLRRETRPTDGWKFAR